MFPTPAPICCRYCGAAAELVAGDVAYPARFDLAHVKVWRCQRCDALVGCHKEGAPVRAPDGSITVSDGTIPLGSLANKELREARKEAHRMFDPLWRDSKRMKRTEAYRWMADQLGIELEDAHVARLEFEQCVKLMHAIENLTRSWKKRASATSSEQHWLTRAQIAFTVDQDDGHLVVTAHGRTIDYWPDRQSWSVRDIPGEQQGFHSLITYCTQRSAKLASVQKDLW